jgi:DNA mismatch repair protein MutH
MQLINSEDELLNRCKAIEGLTIGQIASNLSVLVPMDPLKRKGSIGSLIEIALGAFSGNKSVPDFENLGIELKTIPINHLYKAAESTFITSIPLLTIHNQTWKTSQCYSKLKRILWIPVEDDERIPFMHRRVGAGILWSPSIDDEAILAQDWQELTNLICMGAIDTISANMGNYLQIRPKASDAKSLCYGFDANGAKFKTLPRGFYLRSSFTTRILL